MINNLQNIASVSAAQADAAKPGQAVAVQFPNLSEQRSQRSAEQQEPASPQEGVASIEELQSAVQELNDKLARQELQVNFSVDQDTGRFVVKVMDSKTGDLVRQIPNEETLQFTRNVERGLGTIVDDRY